MAKWHQVIHLKKIKLNQFFFKCFKQRESHYGMMIDFQIKADDLHKVANQLDWI